MDINYNEIYEKLSEPAKRAEKFALWKLEKSALLSAGKINPEEGLETAFRDNLCRWIIQNNHSVHPLLLPVENFSDKIHSSLIYKQASGMADLF